jgi:hypothetical protein
MYVSPQMLFSNSKFLGDKWGDRDGNHTRAISLAVIAFCLMDLSINALQVRRHVAFTTWCDIVVI